MTNSDITKKINALFAEADELELKLKQAGMKKKKSMLIVEDDHIYMEVLKKLFEREYQLNTYYNGEEALQALPRLGVDVAILDMKLPGIQGLDLIREVQNQKPKLPIIVHTGYPGTYDEEEIKKGATVAFYAIKGQTDVKTLVASAQEASEVYKNIRLSFHNQLVQTVKDKGYCPHSAIFNLDTGMLESDVQMKETQPNKISGQENKQAYCYLSGDLSGLVKDGEKISCPFLQSVQPTVNIGIRSHPCSYYNVLGEVGNTKSWNEIITQVEQSGKIN